MSLDAFSHAINAKDKELFLIPNATRMQTYFKEPYVDMEVDKLVEFFGKHLR